MLQFPNGETRIHVCIGDPIAQVRSPAGLTRIMAERAVNAICIPLHVAVEDFAPVMGGLKRMKNVDGIVVTVPHKFTARGHCDRVTPRAEVLGAVNVLRREAGGRWFGDLTDGGGVIAALRAKDFRPDGKRALVVGAGGAGSAVALALLDAGAAEVAVHDVDTARRDRLVATLARHSDGRARAGTADPGGFDFVFNATPVGMAASDPFPIEIGGLSDHTLVGDAITRPAVTPLLEAARALGCRIQTGAEMFAAQSELLVDLLLGTPA